jgi:hypothetical protein
MMSFARRTVFTLVALAVLLICHGCDPGPIIWRVDKGNPTDPRKSDRGAPWPGPSRSDV